MKNSEDTNGILQLTRIALKDKKMLEEEKVTFPLECKELASHYNNKGNEENAKEVEVNQSKEENPDAIISESKPIIHISAEATKSLTSDKLISKISEDIIQKSKKLTLTVIEGGNIPKDSAFEINAGGYIKSQRKANDGVIYFGNNDRTKLSVFYLIKNIITIDGCN